MCSLVPLRKAAYVRYRTTTAILLHRERGRNNAEMYAVLVVTPPPPLQREVTFQKGGRKDTRVRYLHTAHSSTEWRSSVHCVYGVSQGLHFHPKQKG